MATYPTRQHVRLGGRVSTSSRRIRAAGEPSMPLDETFPFAVTFIVGEQATVGGTSVRTPIGTGFVLRMQNPNIKGLGHEYIVTAAHIVEAGQETWVRFRKRGGGVHDLSVGRWILHPAADVALTPLRGHGGYGLDLRHIPVEVLVGSGAIGGWTPTLADRVYFLGLLSQHEEMGERNVPMVRSGIIGALYEQRVPMRRADGSITRIEAHLIDCRSYGGFSGSPCFVQREDYRFEKGQDRWIVFGHGHLTFLLGLVSAHFDDWQKARLTGDLGLEPGSVEAPMNTGVGVVTPSEKILEALNLEEIAKDREVIEREHLDRQGSAATQDEETKQN